MAISLVGSGSAAATSVTIPSHQAGDLIVISARRANNTPATIPAASGTVPTWSTAQSAGANTLSLATVYTVATASNHTSGTFTNASHLLVSVYRPTVGTISAGASSSNNANNTQTIVYPALTLQTATGSSLVHRVGTRGTADDEIGNAPSNYTARWSEPGTSGAASASTLMVRHKMLSSPRLNPAAQRPSPASGEPLRFRCLTSPNQVALVRSAFSVAEATSYRSAQLPRRARHGLLGRLPVRHLRCWLLLPRTMRAATSSPRLVWWLCR